ncbi:hypothetical protein CAMSH0001_0520 [Campylobacter showae RM3277]|uniref:Uncharacterized protein n=1 Tax=Campylobacter showae RM3277 TaxID=553219 RepID=C6RFL4_9BACT|nr:hypothetical protein CAMSH0001_0520 [Campylobacter showae RM3277]
MIKFNRNPAALKLTFSNRSNLRSLLNFPLRRACFYIKFNSRAELFKFNLKFTRTDR